MAPPLLKQATYSAFATSAIFWILFQLSKIRAIQNVAHFADDPYDAIASFAVQIAFAVALLSLARLVSIKNEDGLRQRLPFLLRGILIIALCIAITLAVDVVALAQAWPLTLSAQMYFLLAGLVLLTLLAAETGMLLHKARRGTGKILVEPAPGALGQAIGDCWTLVALPPNWLVAHLTFLKPIWNWADSFAHKIADAWNKRMPFANPYLHPWNFAMLFAALLGFAIMGVILVSERIVEGGPPNLYIGFLLACIFFGGEMVAIFLSFLLLGGFLGLRPKI